MWGVKMSPTDLSACYNCQPRQAAERSLVWATFSLASLCGQLTITPTQPVPTVPFHSCANVYQSPPQLPADVPQESLHLFPSERERAMEGGEGYRRSDKECSLWNTTEILKLPLTAPWTGPSVINVKSHSSIYRHPPHIYPWESAVLVGAIFKGLERGHFI